MSDKKTNILCSLADTASRNIKEKLLLLQEWKTVENLPGSWEGLSCILETDSHRIIEIVKHHIYQDRIDEKMRQHGFDTDLIIVASKHKSSDGRAVLTAHFTGNVKSADFGGRPFELSVPAPFVISSILRNMQRLAEGTNFEINMESTHHGPTDMRTPMVYAEIGSGEEQWAAPVAGEIVARAILEARPEKKPVAIGFGGGHYASRQTKLLLEEDITFGHNFPDHQLSDIDTDLIQQAFNKSRADFVYLDRRSMPSRERDRIQNIIRELGYIILREGDIKELRGLDWELFLQVRNMAEGLCPGGRFRITENFKTTAAALQDGRYEKMYAARANDQLFQETAYVDKEALYAILERLAPIYIEKENGTVSGQILGFGERIRITTQDIINECIKILKEHYEIKYIPDENILYVISKKFDPKAAKDFGISPGPMLGELAKGNSVVVEGRTIKPDMVHKRIIKEIILSD